MPFISALKLGPHAQREASDWKFSTAAELDHEGTGEDSTAAIRLVRFISASANTSAWVIYVGAQTEAEAKIEATTEGIQVFKDAVEGMDDMSRLKMRGGGLKFKLPRHKFKENEIESISIRKRFSMNDLHGAEGEIAGIGIGAALGASAQRITAKKDGAVLFDCMKLALDFGRMGASGNELKGYWYVVKATASDEEVTQPTPVQPKKLPLPPKPEAEPAADFGLWSKGAALGVAALIAYYWLLPRWEAGNPNWWLTAITGGMLLYFGSRLFRRMLEVVFTVISFVVGLVVVVFVAWFAWSAYVWYSQQPSETKATPKVKQPKKAPAPKQKAPASVENEGQQD